MLQQDSRASLAMNVEHDTMIAAESEPDSLCGRLIDNYSSRFWGCWVGCGGGLWRWAVAVGEGGMGWVGTSRTEPMRAFVSGE